MHPDPGLLHNPGMQHRGVLVLLQDHSPCQQFLAPDAYDGHLHRRVRGFLQGFQDIYGHPPVLIFHGSLASGARDGQRLPGCALYPLSAQ